MNLFPARFAWLVVAGLLAVGASARAQPPASVPAPVTAPLPISEAAGIMGRRVRGTDGKDIGRIVDVIVDQAGQPRAAVIDFGGFLGVGNRKIAVDWSTLHFAPGDQAAPVVLTLTPDQMKAAPEYKESTATPPAVVTPPPPPEKPTEAPAPAKP